MSTLAIPDLIKSLTPIELGLHGTLVGVLLICMLLGRRIFWAGDAFMSAVLGAALLVAPKQLLGLHLSGGAPDALHEFIVRGIGAQMFIFAVYWFLLRNSDDRRMFGCQMLSRIVTLVLLSMAIAYAWYTLHGRKTGVFLNDRFALVYGTVVTVSLVGNVIHGLRGAAMGAHGQSQDWLATTMAIDAAAQLLIGITNYAYTMPIMKTLFTKSTQSIDGVHVCLWRVLTVGAFSVVMSSSNCAGFTNDFDRRAHVLTRLMSQIAFFGWNVYGHFVLDLFTMYHVTPFMMSGFYITYLLSIYFRFGKTSAKSSPTRFDEASPVQATEKSNAEPLSETHRRRSKKQE